MAAKTPAAMGEIAIAAINKYFTKAVRYEKAVLKDQDPENLHQMRVNMRRLRTALQVFAPAIALPPAAQEPAVAKIARRLGNLRDLDVTADLLTQQYLPDLPQAEGDRLQKALKALAKQRKRTYKRVKVTLTGDRYGELKKALNAWGHTPSCNVTASLPLTTTLPDLTLPLVSHLWLHPGWLIATQVSDGGMQPHPKLEPEVIDRCVTESSPVLHSLRKQVKRVRYQLSLVSEHYGDRLQADLDRLQALQESLGDLQDTWVLADFLSQTIPGWEGELPTLKSLLMDSRQRAWYQWQTLQQHYLQPEHRNALRHILMTPGADAPPPPKASTAKKSATKSRSRAKTTTDSPPAAPPKTTRRTSRSRKPRSSSGEGSSGEGSPE